MATASRDGPGFTRRLGLLIRAGAMTKLILNTTFGIRLSENRLSCGPFTVGGERHLTETLRELGLSLDDRGGLGGVTHEFAGGLRLDARGDGVRGYLLADDGEEAELQDLKRLVLACALPGREVRFFGHHHLAEGKIITVSSRAVHDGRDMRWSSTRTILGPLGEVRTVRDQLSWEPAPAFA